MEAMSPLAIIKTYFKGSGAELTSGEILGFKKACTEEQWKEYITVAASQLGVEVKWSSPS